MDGSLFVIGVWRSWLARTAGGREVAGSSPVTPTITSRYYPQVSFHRTYYDLYGIIRDVMKTLKLDHALARAVQKGEKTATWRIFDDKDLSVNDTVLLIDKLDPKDPSTWQPIGVATISEVVQKRLGDISTADMEGYKYYESADAMLAEFRQYYDDKVTLDTPVKMIHFSFSPDIPVAQNTERALLSAKKVQVYADGGSRGNPGPSASGYVILDEQGTQLAYRGIYLGVTTNNQAEYTALKLALEEAKHFGAQEVSVYMDSLLVVNQMKGIFKVKNRDLWPIHDTLKQLVTQFEHVTFTHVPRELNRLADAAVNEALDKHLDHPLDMPR